MTQSWRVRILVVCIPAIVGAIVALLVITGAFSRNPVTSSIWVKDTATQTCPERRRVQWELLSSQDQALYIEALGLSMDRGFHALFASIHSDGMSNNAAHQHCAFFYWHRRYLLAYENMLRSLGPEYECITIPYWNYFQEAQRYDAGQCDSQESCSPFLQGLGGSAGPVRDVSILGEASISGNCVSRPPGNHFCQDAYARPSSCINCMPRGDWRRSTMNSSFLQLRSVMQTLVDSRSSLEYFRLNVEMGFHVVIHDASSGLLVHNPYAAFDPIFHSHHATVDLVFQLFHDCFIDDATTNAAAISRLVSCRPVVDGEIFPEIFMQLPDEDGNLVAADAHPELRPFFADLPRNYDAYVNSKDPNLRDNVYSYSHDSLFRGYINSISSTGCPALNKNQRTLRNSQTS